MHLSSNPLCLFTDIFRAVLSDVGFIWGKNFECKVNQFVLNAGYFTSSAPPPAPPMCLHAV